MMRKLRESTKVIMIIVAFAFVGLMVFEWGMDLSGTASPTQSAGTELGSVNGTEITVQEYQRQYNILLDQAQQQNPEGLSSEELDQIEQQSWEDVVDLTLLRQKARERGVNVTDSELVEYIKNTPPPEMQDLPAFQTEGQFDIQKYREALADPALSETWRRYEEQLRRTLPIQKLQEQIIAGVAVTEAELLEAFRERNERARIAYLYLDPEVLAPAGTIDLPETEVREYYERHKEEFARKASARMRYVAFEAVITAADSSAALALADSLAEVARDPENDFAELAREHSDDRTTAENGGNLGWIRPEAMAPAFAEALRSMEPGEVVGPIETPFGWHVIRLDDRQTQEGETRVQARHILIEPEPSSESRQEIRGEARDFAAAASAAGTAFVDAAAERGLEVSEPPVFEKGVVVPGLGPAPVVSDFVFQNPAGSVSGALEQKGTYYVIEVAARYPAGYIALERVAPEIRERLTRERQIEKSREAAPEIAEIVRRRGLEAAAERYGLRVHSTDWFNRTNNIPGIGSGTPVAGAAFGLSEGQLAGPVETDRGLYFLRVLEKQPFDPQEFERQKPQLREQLRMARMRSIFTAWFEAQREQAKIVDNRSQLLGT